MNIGRKPPTVIAGAILVLGLSVILFAAETDSGPDQKDENLANYFKGLYHREPGNSPARYALNQIASAKSSQARQVLKHSKPSSPEEQQQARQYLEKLREDIRRGVAWPVKERESLSIPFSSKPPVIDGHINEDAWQHALALSGEYPLDSFKENASGAQWKIMWDFLYIYVGAVLPDNHLVHGNFPPGAGDALEVFLMPDPELRCYREIVLGSGTNFFTALHLNNKWGTFINGKPEESGGIKFACSSSETHFTVELAIPFTSLPNYKLGNPPRSGESIFFTLVRADRDPQGQIAFSSFRPLLYSGHNIFAYPRGILIKEQ